MMIEIEVKKYTLPDAYLFENKVNTPTAKVWISTETCVILGKSNNPLNSIFIDKIIEDNIPVYKRPSGGETVILSNKMIVISVVIKQTSFKSGKTYFEYFNKKIISALEKAGVDNLYRKGISDISINDLKILGSAIYQNKNVVFYHSVLNLSESIELIDKYLKHPVREPDYRQNRSHKEFVTSLEKEGYSININDLKNKLENEFENINFE